MTRATKDELRALAARVEAAQGPNYALEVEIAVATTPGLFTDGGGVVGFTGKGDMRPPPAYTASLDAAHSLLPEGWGVSIDASSPDEGVDVRLLRYVGAGKVQEVEASASGDHAEPRARTAAALRARAEEISDE